MNLHLVCAAAFALAMAVSCNQGEFSGAGGKKAADAKKEQPKPAPAPAPSPSGKDGKKPSDDGGDEGKNDDGKEDDPTNNDEGGDESTDLSNIIDNNKPQPPAPPNTSLVDLLSGLLNTTNDIVPNQPNDNTIIFGGNKAFHIGDGQQANSSCIQQLTVLPLSGNKYVFEFDVLKDGVDVTVDVQLCGVDYSTNVAYIAKGGQAVGTTPIPKGASTVQVKGTGLAKGKYSIVIESKAAGQENPQVPTDHDDFISQEVKVQSTGPIKPGKVGTI